MYKEGQADSIHSTCETHPRVCFAYMGPITSEDVAKLEKFKDKPLVLSTTITMTGHMHTCVLGWEPLQYRRIKRRISVKIIVSSPKYVGIIENYWCISKVRKAPLSSRSWCDISLIKRIENFFIFHNYNLPFKPINPFAWVSDSNCLPIWFKQKTIVHKV